MHAQQLCHGYGCTGQCLTDGIMGFEVIHAAYLGGKQSVNDVQVLEDHSRPVLSLAIADNKLFSGSYDYTIKVWSLDTLQRLKTLTGRLLILILNSPPYFAHQ